jgi:hypothetical protein
MSIHRTSILLAVAVAVASFAAAGSAHAAEATADPEPAAQEPESDTSLTPDLGVSSAYVWRGANLWGGLANNDKQAFTLFPSVTFAKGDFSAFYWGAYQLTGKTKGPNLDAGVGAEQDLGVSYGISLTEELSLTPWLTYYVYPFADTGALGGTPMWLEPGITVSYATAVTIALGVSYYKAITVTDASDVYSHIYLGPSVGKDIELAPALALNLSVGGGYKLHTNSDYDAKVVGNNWDVQANAGVTYETGDLYVKPAIHAGTTDMPDGVDGNGLFYYGCVNVGYGIAL